MPEESIRHALTGFVYTRQEDGRVRVTDPKTGRIGLFASDGTWQSGELTYVDHHMLGHMRARRAAAKGAYGGGQLKVAPATADPPSASQQADHHSSTDEGEQS